MATKHELQQRHALKKNVLDDVVYTKAQKVWAYIGLAIGLWGVFFGFVFILFLMTQNLWGPIVEFTPPTILAN
ncbi:MAG: hypothetical protein LUC49_06565 [Prevotella sp.]|nr:hypothetical protein [Prevotella sp.]MCD8306301.1 hypothetical protein [Prevotella sp.]